MGIFMQMKYGCYQIVKELGKGAMGVVYQAHDPHIDRLVALKVLGSNRITNEDFVQRFLKEAKVIGRLSHPNIVIVYDVGKDHETIYIAMEYLEGESLNKISQKKRLSLEEITDLGVHAALALDYAHQKGIVHQDIKPSNIIIQPDGRIKITDFGIAHIEDPSAPHQTQTGEILGSLTYMSPEQVMSQTVDGRTDLYSLGGLLYELCTGLRPFQGENLPSLFRAITQDRPAEPKITNPAIPQVLSQTIMQCLDKQPEKRFQTGKAMAEALKDSLKKSSRLESNALTTQTMKSRLKHVTYVFLTAVILVSLIGGFSYYFMNKDRKKEMDSLLPAMEMIAPAFLKVQSTPIGAQVFVDGMFKGKAPVKLELSPGKHEVRLTLPDYYDWEDQIQLKEESETPLLVRLIPTVDQ